MNLSLRFYILSMMLISLIIIESCSGRKSVDYNDFKEQIENLAEDYHYRGEFDGVILVGDSNHVIFQEAFGYSDRENQIPMKIESQFYLASVSKQFTASAILLLIQQGKISLDQEIVEFLHELPEVYHSITFRHLLNHMSGIPDYYNFTEPWEGFTNPDVLHALAYVDSLEFEPGTRYAYSNSGYVLLSTLVNRISGITFAEFLYRHAFDIAGLGQTIVFDEFASEPRHRVKGYGSDSALTDYTYRTTGGGGIFSCVGDLYLWHKALLNDKVLKQEILQQAYLPSVLNGDSLIYYGFGWNLDPADSLHVWHSGELEGFRTWFDRRLDDGKVIILLSNNSSPSLQAVAAKIWDYWPNTH